MNPTPYALQCRARIAEMLKPSEANESEFNRWARLYIAELDARPVSGCLYLHPVKP